MLLILNNLTLYARMAGQSLAYFGSGRWRRTSHQPGRVCQVPADFFGLCVANAPDPASDDYVIARLNNLGLRHVRLDFTYTDREAYTERFLDRLLAEGFRVCLHLVQPREEARVMLRQPEAAERWRAFVGEMLDQYGRRMELIEIGATCNRRKWSGHSPAAFLAAWQIAWEEAHGRNLSIAGPNVTDFEPVYNAGWLGCLRRLRMAPSAHTDNLFVERCTEPEAFDHKIAGKSLAGLLRFNLVRKAQLLSDIGAWAGVPTLICAHVSWSLRRIARALEDVEEKQADYLARYLCLAAASGALTRVYWGPLIGQREGLIDDGTAEYPEIPNVTYYEQARGEMKNYRLRPAFRAFETVSRLLRSATFQRRLPTGPGLEILEFGLNADDGSGKEKQTPNHAKRVASIQFIPLRAGHPTPNAQFLHAVWTTDGRGAGADECYPPELLAQAEVYSRDGERLPKAPRMFCESPVYLLWPSDVRPPALDVPESGVPPSPKGLWRAGRRPAFAQGAMAGRPSSVVRRPITGIRFAHRPGWKFDVIRLEAGQTGFDGVYLAEAEETLVDIQALIDMLGQGNSEVSDQRSAVSNSAEETGSPKSAYAPRSTLQTQRILRAARNTVWSVSAPWDSESRIVIKAFARRGALRRLLDCGKPDKALRSWNNAQELIRRGLSTPTPLACLLPARHAAASYYICEMFANTWSARDIFNAFRAGATEFKGHSAGAWYAALALFLQKLHTRGVYFRDLSAGNLLARESSAGEPELALIDTARARFFPGSLGLRLRLCDLMRICHPLHWAGRNVFMEQYLAHSGRRFHWWLKIPFLYYDTKHWLKNRWKKARRK
ncbi:MAG: hypothetical protein HYV35_00900 [Lentisphaerae bacterium]|nr:hypothetical protein [Lentisphaerota bacterium]